MFVFGSRNTWYDRNDGRYRRRRRRTFSRGRYRGPYDRGYARDAYYADAEVRRGPTPDLPRTRVEEMRDRVQQLLGHIDDLNHRIDALQKSD